jgi:uncharacterized membrane protein
MAAGHTIKPVSWVTVALIIVASVVLGFALPTRSLTLAIVGGAILLVGLIMAVVFRIMDEAH